MAVFNVGEQQVLPVELNLQKVGLSLSVASQGTELWSGDAAEVNGETLHTNVPHMVCAYTVLPELFH